MPMKDEEVVDEVVLRLKIVEGTFQGANIDDYVVVRMPRDVTRKLQWVHFYCRYRGANTR